MTVYIAHKVHAGRVSHTNTIREGSSEETKRSVSLLQEREEVQCYKRERERSGELKQGRS